MKKFQKFCLTALSFLAVLALFAPPVAVSAQEVAFEPQQEYVEVVPYNTWGTLIRNSRVYSVLGGPTHHGRYLGTLSAGTSVFIEGRFWASDGVAWLRLGQGRYIRAADVH